MSRAATKEWKTNNRVRHNAVVAFHRLNKIGAPLVISQEEFVRLHETKPSMCEICHKEIGEITVKRKGVAYQRSKLHLDHDHSTGQVRGWVCNACNMMLGGARDSIANLESASRYLRKYLGLISVPEAVESR